LLGLHDVDGDAAAVVDDRGRAVGVEVDLDGVGLAGEGLVDGVVDDLGEELVVAVDARAALHVHRGPLADAFEAPQDLDVLRRVRAQPDLRGRPPCRPPQTADSTPSGAPGSNGFLRPGRRKSPERRALRPALGPRPRVRQDAQALTSPLPSTTYL